MEGLQLVKLFRDHSATCSLPSSSQGYGCITEAHTNKSNPIPGYSDPAKRLTDRLQFVIELHQTPCLPLALCKIVYNLCASPAHLGYQAKQH